MKSLNIECPHCGAGVKLTETLSQPLAELIEDVSEKAFEDGKAEGSAETAVESAEIHELELIGTDRAFYELAAAISAGRLDDAAYHLDKLAERGGPKAQHEVSLGRYAPHARAA
ncbi:MAG: hypothetical protein AAFP79_05060 [Pseudomonadota bacterium]